MSLNWDISKVENKDKVCFTGEGEDRKLNPVTEAIIFRTMLVDIGRITEQNYEEFARRSRIADRVFHVEPIRERIEGTEVWTNRSFTIDEVKAHIGLSTNVITLTDSKWWKKIFDNIKREEEDQVTKWIRKQKLELPIQ